MRATIGRGSVVGVAASSALAAFAGCQPPTEITLALSTDMACGTPFQGLTVTVGGRNDVETQDPVTSTTQCDAATGRIGSLVVIPSDAKDDEVAIKVVAGRDMSPELCTSANDYGADAVGSAGCAVARRILHFVPHTPLELPIQLRDVCVGVRCLPSETCVNGICASAEITTPDLCVDGVACAEPGLFPDVPDDPVMSVSAGFNTTCALKASHQAYCWGDNSAGAFGTGQLSPYGVAQAVTAAMTGGVVAPVAIEINEKLGCALDADGTVHCAGTNQNGELGNGAQDPSASPVPVSDLADVLELSVSSGGDTGSTSCARLGDGTVRCWGFSNEGRLGDGVDGAHLALTPVTVVEVAGASDLSTTSHSCVIVPGGAVKCWGAATRALGPGVDSPTSTPLTVTGLGPVPVVEVSAGIDSTCARHSDGRVTCWPYLGRGDMPDILEVPGITDALQVSLGTRYSCALLPPGRVVCWGRNDYGELGIGSSDPATPHEPSEVLEIGDAAQLSAGPHHGCVRRANGRVSCWGANDFGQSSGDGVATAAPVLTPVDVPIP
jgi:hypothetical protein